MINTHRDAQHPEARNRRHSRAGRRHSRHSMTSLTRTFLLLAALVPIACVAKEDAEPRRPTDGTTEPSPADDAGALGLPSRVPIHVAGTYARWHEGAGFQVCGKDDWWWPRGLAGRVRRLQEPEWDGGSTRQYHVRGTAVLSGPGHFGHLGELDRAIRFMSVDELFRVTADAGLPEEYCP